MVEQLSIMIGYRCQASCRHCLSESSPHAVLDSSDEEIDNIVSSIHFFKNLKRLLFTGGEPILYLEKINKILSRIRPDILENLSVRMISNAIFARSKDEALRQLRILKKIDVIIVSWDVFHEEFCPVERIENLESACKELGVMIQANVVISTPFDMKYVSYFRKKSIDVTTSPLAFYGRASSLDRTKFPSAIQENPHQNRDTTCPADLRTVTFFPSKGFTLCCSNLILKNLSSEKIFFSKVEELYSSHFESLLRENTFAQMATSLSVENKNAPSNCELCELFMKENL